MNPATEETKEETTPKPMEEMTNEEFMESMKSLSSQPYETTPVSEETKDVSANIEVDAEPVGDPVTDEHEANKATDNNNIPEEDNPDVPNETEVGVEVHNESSDKLDSKNESMENYEKYKSFYDKLTSSSIELGGVELKGLDDADAILATQKSSFENSRKLDEFKEMKPIMKTLKENGLTDDPERLAMVVEALNGNAEAIKMMVKNSNIDPFELDFENIDASKVDSSKYTQSDFELKFEEFVDKADSQGVQDVLISNVIQRWDNDSLARLADTPSSGVNIINHLKSGAFEDVQKEMINLERSDRTGEFKQLSDFDKYAEASNVLADRYTREAEASKVIADTTPESTTSTTPVATSKKEEKEDETIIEDRVEKAKKASDATSAVDKSTSKKDVEYSDLNNEDFMKAMYGIMN